MFLDFVEVLKLVLAVYYSWNNMSRHFGIDILSIFFEPSFPGIVTQKNKKHTSNKKKTFVNTSCSYVLLNLVVNIIVRS